MASPFSDELISAYLDGELTADEQARVEKQLREDSELRRMCDELRALRLTLQSMPFANPPEDLADRVLRQAERRMLAGDVPATDAVTVATHEQPVTHAGAGHWLRDWRMAAGAIASLAALLLLTLWLPGQVRNVAQGPAASVDAESLAERSPDTSARTELERTDHKLGFRSELAQEHDGATGGAPQNAAGGMPGDATTFRSRARIVPGVGEEDASARESEAAPTEPKRDAYYIAPNGLPAPPGMTGEAAGMEAGGAGAAGGYGGARLDAPMGMGAGMAPTAGRSSLADQPAAEPSRQIGEGDGAVAGKDAATLPMPDVEPLVDQFNQNKLLLVQVRVSDPVRAKSVGQVVDMPPHDQALDIATFEKLFSGRAVEGSRLSGQLRYYLPEARLDESGQSLIVVDGTAEQVRLTLVGLASQPGIVLQPEAANVDELRTLSRSFGRTLEEQVLSTPTTPNRPQEIRPELRDEGKEKAAPHPMPGAASGTGLPEMQTRRALAAGTNVGSLKERAHQTIKKQVDAKNKGVEAPYGAADSAKSDADQPRPEPPAAESLRRNEEPAQLSIVRILFRLKSDSEAAAQPEPAKKE